MKVVIVAAVARNGVIGRDGGLPWRVPEDMAHFRALTMGHPVVMGRRTWESLPDQFRPLPGRRNIVVTRDPGWAADGAERAGSLEEALQLLEGASRVSVIGGGKLFAAALPLADELELTELDLEVDGDTFFPAWDRDAFMEAGREEHVSSGGTPFAFATYKRTGPEQALHSCTPSGTERAYEILELLLAGVDVLELDPDLAERAAQLARTSGLRAYDAVHLASYERMETSDSVLVAADGGLARIAAASEHAVAVPGA